MFVEKKYIYIKCNIWRVALRPSYIQDARFLKVKTTVALTRYLYNIYVAFLRILDIPSCLKFRPNNMTFLSKFSIAVCVWDLYRTWYIKLSDPAVTFWFNSESPYYCVVFH